jgi:hypothetical protein
LALCRTDRVERRVHRGGEVFVTSFKPPATEDGLATRENVLDGIEPWAVWRRETQDVAFGGGRGSHGRGAMEADVVKQYRPARGQQSQERREGLAVESPLPNHPEDFAGPVDGQKA